MKNTTIQKLRALEKLIGFSIDRRRIPLELNEPHDEIFSYNLCLRFYEDREGLLAAINSARDVLRSLLAERRNNPGPKLERSIGLLYSLIGNMHYILGDFNVSAGYFIKCLSYEKNDMTPWIELLFSVRAMGEYELFEDGIFNLDKLVKRWREDIVPGFSQVKLISMIKEIK